MAPDVLKELMDHFDLKTTQNYYRASQERRRDAVDRVVALQFDLNGTRDRAPGARYGFHQREARTGDRARSGGDRAGALWRPRLRSADRIRPPEGREVMAGCICGTAEAPGTACANPF